MKILNILFITLLSISFVGCSGDDDSNDSGVNEGQLIAIIDGVSYSAEDTNASAALFNGIFNITTTNPTTGETITITVSNAAEGTFDLSSAANNINGGAYTLNGENAYLSNYEGGTGTMTISKLDTENLLTSGTFEFVGVRESLDADGNIVTETITITNGEFNNLPLVTEVIGNPDNSLDATIDGEALNADSVTALEIDLLGNTTLAITAINNTTNQNIAISMPADITVGTHDFESLPLPGAIIGQYTPNLGGGNETYVSIDGTITIISYDTVTGVMEGSFEFTAGDFLAIDDTTFSITNGSFSVEFQ